MRNVREATLKKANNCVNGKRQSDYGTPEDNFRVIADLWSIYLTGDMYTITPKDVAIMMALMKIGRIATGGEKPTLDSFVDLAGYAACAAEIVHGGSVQGLDLMNEVLGDEIIPDNVVDTVDKAEELYEKVMEGMERYNSQRGETA